MGFAIFEVDKFSFKKRGKPFLNGLLRNSQTFLQKAIARNLI